MARFFGLIGLVLLTLAGLVIFTEYEHFTSVTRVAGYPVVDIAQFGAQGWVAIGQVNAQGLVSFAQVGFGVVGFIQAGVAVFFGLGQAVLGLAAIAQVAISPTFFMGQVGVSMQALGQAVFKRRDYLKAMSAELGELLGRKQVRRFQRMSQAPAPANTGAHAERDRAGWPMALVEALPRVRDLSLDLAAGAHGLRCTPTTVEVSWQAGGAAQRVIVEDRAQAVVQLSRSCRPRRLGWLLGLVGKSPVEHVLHVELRLLESAERVGLQAVIAPSMVHGLPWLEQTGTTVDTDALGKLVTHLRSLGVEVARADRRDEAASRAPVITRKAFVFDGVKALTRGLAVALRWGPVLLAPKLVLWMVGSGLGDYLTVAYAVLLCVFFGALNVLLFMFPFVGPADPIAELEPGSQKNS